MTDTATPRFTLRQLTLPAKLVLTVFLLAVALGYVSAMVQLHMQHSDRDGTPMPTVENVVAVFAGKKWQNPEDEERTVSKLESIISGDPKANDLTSKNMTPAFFHLDEANFAALVKRNPEKAFADRDGERLAIIAWIKSTPEVRRRAYDEDNFWLPKDRIGKPLTPGYRAGPEGAKVKLILNHRCVRCHRPGGEKQDTPLNTYEALAPYLPSAVEVPPGGGYVESGRIMSLEKLTQSTHAHLLTFALLFAATGLIFAFSSYPGIVRGILGPLVLVAQVADVSCWWLARMDGVGPYFAMCIVGTGGIVGLGLMTQIVLSLFNMYGRMGKLVMLLLFLVAATGAGWAFVKVVSPYLEQQRKEKQDAKAAASANGKSATPAAPEPVAGPGKLEKLLTGDRKTVKWGKNDGGMVLAFFDKDNEFKKADDEEKAKLAPEREGERAALLAWVKATEEVRKKAFAEDHFFVPPDLAGKPLTEDFRHPGGGVKIALLIEERCARCHKEGGPKEEILLEKYEQIQKYFGTAKDAPAPIPMSNK